jgi:hypothetical protein
MFTNTTDRNGGLAKFSSDVTSFTDLDFLVSSWRLFLLCFSMKTYISVCDQTGNCVSHMLGFQIRPIESVLF